MIKRYEMNCPSCNFPIRMDFARPIGMEEFPATTFIPTVQVDELKSFEQYFYEKLHKRETLILEDTYQEYPIYRTLIFDETKGLYVDKEKDVPFNKKFLYDVLENKIDVLRFVIPLNGKVVE